MPSPDHDRREPTSLSSPIRAPAIIAALLIIAIGGMTTYLALRFDALRPAVGDIIAFLPAHGDADSWQLTVATTDVAGRDQAAGPCVFDPSAMSANGGSLVVEARQDASPPRYLLHWAGQHTAEGAGDCGAAADVTLDRYDVQRLANSAGGFGVKPSTFR
jgi:hypothetical protein